MAVEQRRLRGRKGLPFSAAVLLVAAFLLSLVAAPIVASAKPVSSSILVDAATGEVLSSSNADARTYPASLTKMMTLYQLFDALKRGQIKLTDTIVFSAHAAAQDATNLAVSQGDTIRVETAIQAVVVRSANDAATAIGEKLAGTEWGFAKRMNATARALGMTNTVFQNANGLPDPDQHTTARDMAILGVALLRDFPEYYHYFSVERFTYHGVQYAGHNHVLSKFDGADGIKTGYIRAAGFNLVTSATRNGRRLVGVILGGQSPYIRDKNMVALMAKGFKTTAGTGTQLALNGTVKTTPTPAAPAAVAATQPATTAVATSAPAPAVMPPPSVAAPAMVATALAPVASTTTVAAATTTPTFSDGTDNQLLPVLKPGTELELTSAAAPDSQSVEPVWHSNTPATYGVQVGAYSQFTPAQNAALRVTRAMPGIFSDARIVVDESNSLYRARLVGLSKADAEQACAKLHAQKADCMVLSTTDGLAKAN
jgi:D-alanyl-D-alanine carboxypeptidase